ADQAKPMSLTAIAVEPPAIDTGSGFAFSTGSNSRAVAGHRRARTGVGERSGTATTSGFAGADARVIGRSIVSAVNAGSRSSTRGHTGVWRAAQASSGATVLGRSGPAGTTWTIR